MRLLELSSVLLSVGFAPLTLQLSSSEVCSWSPLLKLNEDTLRCSTTLGSQKSHTDEGVGPADKVEQSNGSAWEGPRHCSGRYCVYWNRQVAGGIAVITTAENVHRIAQVPDLSLLAAEHDVESTPSPAFYATSVPGKGIGLVANRAIRRGERIMTEQPAFLVHRQVAEELAPAAHERILDAALLRLPAVQRRAFTRQMGQFGGHRVSDILLTNSFQVAVGAADDDGSPDTYHHLGSFPGVSRLNHDCRPNLAFRVDERTLAHHTHAVRNIAAGEELTIAYLNPFETRAARQAHIRQSWGFACTCAHCSLPSAEAAESDGRLLEIEIVETELSDFNSRKASTEMVERLLALYEAERLDAKMHGAYVLAALNYNLFGDAEMARKFAALAVKAGIMEFGPETVDVVAMTELGENPKGHWSWSKRIGN